MCLVAFAIDRHPDYKLILVANRDEFYKRDSAPLHWWKDNPEILGGRDIEKGGSWLGVNKKGRFAVITNYREFPRIKEFATSRGDLVKSYLENEVDPQSYLHDLENHNDEYEGYNLIFGDANEVYYFSNKAKSKGLRLRQGVYGLSNHLLDTPWPKVEEAKACLAEWIESGQTKNETLLESFNNNKEASEDKLPDTGIGSDWEKKLSSMFIKTDEYGTRCTTILSISTDNTVSVTELAYVPPSRTEIQFKF